MTIATFQDVQDAQARGEAFDLNMVGVASGSTNNATAASGGITSHLLFNSVGTTLQTALQGFPVPTGLAGTDTRVMSIQNSGVRQTTYALVNLYTLGTANLATTGQQFTHNAATFPLLRTRMGQASQPISGYLFFHQVTTGATTAPIFTVKYVDQAGNTVTGAKTMTWPAVAVVGGSGFFARLENTDSSIRDLTEVNVTTAGTAGTCNVYLMEFLGFASQALLNLQTVADLVYTGFAPPMFSPATATSGTAVWTPGLLTMGTGATEAASMNVRMVQNL